MAEFHETKMGRDFYDRTMPDLVRQLAKLNRSLERHAMVEDLRRATEDLVDAAQRVLNTQIVPGSNVTITVFRDLRHAIREANDAIREIGD